MMARGHGEIMNIAGDYIALIERLIALEKQGSSIGLQQHARSVSTIIKFTYYEELRTLFNGIFKYAVASGIIQHNPVALIKFVKADRQSRVHLMIYPLYNILQENGQVKSQPIVVSFS